MEFKALPSWKTWARLALKGTQQCPRLLPRLHPAFRKGKKATNWPGDKGPGASLEKTVTQLRETKDRALKSSEGALASEGMDSMQWRKRNEVFWKHHWTRSLWKLGVMSFSFFVHPCGAWLRVGALCGAAESNAVVGHCVWVLERVQVRCGLSLQWPADSLREACLDLWASTVSSPNNNIHCPEQWWSWQVRPLIYRPGTRPGT